MQKTPERIDFGVGVLVFNPVDDPAHLERIQKCLSSIQVAIESASGLNIKVHVGLNHSQVDHLGVKGIGPKTQAWLDAFLSKHPDHFKATPFDEKNSLVYGYDFLLRGWKDQTEARRVVIFADDYILPRGWFSVVNREFSKRPDADFIMPSTCFVAQKNLLVPMKLPAHWELHRSETGEPIGAKTGVTIDDVDRISRKAGLLPTIRFVGPPSFETTVFTRAFLERFGTLHTEYYSMLYDFDYIVGAVTKGAVGYISRKAFVFHHGKGGTAAAYKATRDEKYKGSPVEEKLAHDVDLYNRRNNAKVPYFWKSAGQGKAPQVAFPSNAQIFGMLAVYGALSFLKSHPRIYQASRRWYHTLRS